MRTRPPARPDRFAAFFSAKTHTEGCCKGFRLKVETRTQSLMEAWGTKLPLIGLVGAAVSGVGWRLEVTIISTWLEETRCLPSLERFQ